MKAAWPKRLVENHHAEVATHSMPTRPSSLCSNAPRCGGRAKRGGRCGRCLTDYERGRGTAAERGYDAEWQALAAEHLALHPWCSDGCGLRATDVDHIVSIRVAPHRRLDPTNLRSYAHGCHSRKTVKEDGGFGRRPADGPADGNPRATDPPGGA